MIKTAFAFLLIAVSGLSAATFTYNVSVNTSSLASTAGTIDFQFNPGDVTSDVATASITNFVITGPGSLTGPPQYFGDAMGDLTSLLTVANTNFDNEALQALTFGSALSFRLRLFEALTGTALTGSVFNFGVFQSDGFTPLLTTDPSGFLITVNLDNAGGAVASTTAAAGNITVAGGATPEPGTIVLVCAGALVFAVAGAKRRQLKSGSESADR